jgi:hypothetical protein
MSVASFIASQRADYGIPHAKCCRFLGVSVSWFYKWHDRPPTKRQRRRHLKRNQASIRKSLWESAGGMEDVMRRWGSVLRRRAAGAFSAALIASLSAVTVIGPTSPASAQNYCNPGGGGLLPRLLPRNVV